MKPSKTSSHPRAAFRNERGRGDDTATPGLPDVDFRYRIFNADGSEVEQCGNGARCFARFVRDQRLTNKKVIRVQTAKGVIELRVGREGMVMVNMGVPEFNPPAIPFAADRR